MHEDEEIGTAMYDFRKLFSKKKLKFSTWLDLNYEGKVMGKLGVCMWVVIDDFLQDMIDEIYKKVQDETRRLYIVNKTELDIEDMQNLDLK